MAALMILLVVLTSMGDSGEKVPRHLTDGAILVGRTEAPVTITVYEDFLCPYCKVAHQAHREQLAAWVSEGTVKIHYRPMSFLDRASTDAYSSRALNAAAAVVDSAPQAFVAFHDALYAEQPKEGGPGLSDKRLVELATAAGAPREAVEAAVADRRFTAWVSDMTEEANAAGVSSTPTIRVDGVTLTDPLNAKALKKAVDAAVEKTG